MTVCIALGSYVPPVLLALISDSNPFRFCSADDPCDGLTCTTESRPLRHFPMNINYQDSIAYWITSIGSNIFQCGAGETLFIKETKVSACKVSNRSCTDLSTSCWDVEIKVTFVGYC
ncbi:MAG: hypothetical protein ABI851_03575 [Saprospiraceae bacterium]